MPPTGVASAVPSLPVLQAAGGPDPADAVRQELEEEVKRLSSRLNKGVLPPLPQPGDVPPHWEAEEQQQAYVGRVIEYVFRIAEPGKRKSKAQLFSYQGRTTRAIGVRRRRAGQFIVLEAEWPTTFNEQTQAFDDTPELQELECHANLYGLQRENGWFVYDGQLEHELEHPAAEPHHSAAADERDQKLMEAMVLCPPKSL